jgi:putative ABC transport system permease protein
MDSRNGFDQQIWIVDHDYIKTMDMKIVSGRAFSKNFGSDSSAIIINQTTKDIMGYDDPVGKKIYSNDGGGHISSYTIIGVVENFHFSSLRQNIGALCMVLGFNPGFASFKVSSKDIKPLLAGIQDKWKAMVPERPFSYRFLDDAFNQMYDEEQRVGKIALSFALLAILIASLGLFGLAIYMAEQRTKEIGVRKVLGATVSDIASMLSKDFLRLVVIAAVFAFPLAWWFMHTWLQDFAYRVNISWWIFILAAVIALAIALATVGFQAIKAAVANPVKSLRTE